MARGSNPVSAFLAGFGVVDQLETNRQRRSFLEQQQEFAAEEHSWRRKAEKRADDLYEQAKIAEYQRKKAVEFEAITTDIQNKVTSQIDAAEAAGDTKLANQLRERWFTGPNAPANLINEGWKRQIARDPTFGEHLAFAFGKDAAAGPLVRDRSKPISAVGFSMPGQAGEGHPGGVWFGVDSVNGMQPMTQFRSSADNDPIFFAQPGMAELVAAYGDSAMTDEFTIMKFLYSAVGGDQPDGQPVEPQKVAANRAATAGGATTTVNPNAGNTTGISEEQQAANLEALRQRQAAGDARRAEEQAKRAAALNSGGPQTVDQLFEEGPVSETTSEEPPVNVPSIDVPSTVTDTLDLGTPINDILGVLPRIPSTVTKMFGLDGLFGDSGPKNTVQVNEAAKEVGSPPASRLTTKAPPLTEEEVETIPTPPKEVADNIATTLVAKRPTYKTKAPPPEDVFMAFMLHKAAPDTIGLDDVMRFRQTGTFNEPAERKLEHFTENGAVHFFSTVPSTGEVSYVGGQQIGPTDAQKESQRAAINAQYKEPRSDFAVRKDQIDLLKNHRWLNGDEVRANDVLVAFDRTESNAASAQRQIEAQINAGQLPPEYATLLPAFNREDSTTLDMLPTAAQWQNNFKNHNLGQHITDVAHWPQKNLLRLFGLPFGMSEREAERWSQKFSPIAWTNSLLQPELKRDNLDIGMLAVANNITNQEAFNEFAQVYGIQYGMWADNQRVTGTQRIVDVQLMERDALQRLQAAQQARERGEGTNIKSLHDARQEAFENFLVERLEEFKNSAQK